MGQRPHARLAERALTLLLLCSPLAACSPPAPPARFDAGFRGPGRLVLLFEPAGTLNTGTVRNERTVEALKRI